MATAADWMSAASFISMAGLISFMGYDGGVYLMGWTGGYVLAGPFIGSLPAKIWGIYRSLILSVLVMRGTKKMPGSIGQGWLQ